MSPGTQRLIREQVQMVIDARKKCKAWAWYHHVYVRGDATDITKQFLKNLLAVGGWRVATSDSLVLAFLRDDIPAVSIPEHLAIEALTNSRSLKIDRERCIPEHIDLAVVFTRTSFTRAERVILLTAIKSERFALCNKNNFARFLNFASG